MNSLWMTGLLAVTTPNLQELPDFSYAGYRAGAGLPARRTGPVFDVTRFGAVPDDGRDDIDAIQKAVDAAAAAGGGVVLLPAGQFDFDVGTTRRCVKIRASHIVIRGAGDKTVLFDHSYSDSPVPQEKWRANEYPSFFHVGPYDARDAVGYLPRLTRPAAQVGPAARGSLTIQTDVPVKAGTYLLTQTDPDGSLTEALAAPMKLSRMARGPARLGVPKFYQVVGLNGGKLDAPLLWELRQQWMPQLWEMPVVREVGIENLTLRTPWKGPFVHHKNAEHDDGWNHIRFDAVENGWVRNVTHDGASAALMWATTKHCVAYDGKITGPRGHNGFNLIGAATYNLLMNLDAGASFHSYQLQGFPCGNVFKNVTASGGGGLDCHGGLGVWNLLDNPRGFGVQHGGSGNATPPRIGRGLVLWNWQPKVVLDDLIPGPLVFGGDGKTTQPLSIWESQRQQRLGAALPRELRP